MKNDNLARRLLNDGTFDVDKFGNFFYKGKHRNIKPNSHGYIKFSCWVDGELKDFAIHRLVMLKYYKGDRIIDDHQVDHKDDDKTNNAFYNLAPLTCKENKAKKSTRTQVRLTLDKAMEILTLHFDDLVSRRKLVEYSGLSSRAVDMLINGNSWKQLDYLRIKKVKEDA
jgi:hypothetical protein